MTFYNITRPETFFRKVLSCQGSVYGACEGHRPQDLKETAEYLISSGMTDVMGTIPQIDVHVEQSGDATILMRYMAEMQRAPRREIA